MHATHAGDDSLGTRLIPLQRSPCYVESFDDNTIESSNQRALIRKELKAQATAVAKSAEPNKLKGEKDWYEWFDSLTNYLSLLLGSNGVTLNYVVRADHHPTPEATYASYMRLGLTPAVLVRSPVAISVLMHKGSIRPSKLTHKVKAPKSGFVTLTIFKMAERTS
jgi:hypothetical protein